MEIITNTIELTNTCNCETYDDEDNLIPADYCLGCYDDELEYLTGELAQWEKANGYYNHTLIRVNVSGATWQRLDGYKDITADQIPKSLNINGDYRIVFDLSADYLTLTARRYSHDEPVGTGLITFTKSPLDACEYCGDPSACVDYDGATICEFCHERETN